MKIKDNLTFSNNGYITGVSTYKIELYNVIDNKTSTFEGSTTVDNTRFINIYIDTSTLTKGNHKGKLYINENLFYTFIGQLDYEVNKFVNEVSNERYTYEV